MRRGVIIAFLILAAAIAGILRIEDNQLNLDVNANTTKVGVILRGTCLDRSYGRAGIPAGRSQSGDGISGGRTA